jgi:hypothetical protein
MDIEKLLDNIVIKNCDQNRRQSFSDGGEDSTCIQRDEVYPYPSNSTRKSSNVHAGSVISSEEEQSF